MEFFPSLSPLSFLLSYPSFSLLFYDMNFIWHSSIVFYRTICRVSYNKLIRTLERMRIVSLIFSLVLATYFPRFDLRRIVPWIYTSRLKTSGKRMNVHLLAIESNNEIWRENFDQGMQIVSNSGLFSFYCNCPSRIADRLI